MVQRLLQLDSAKLMSIGYRIRLKISDFAMLFHYKLRNIIRTKVCFIDIDNTIANTWPTLIDYTCDEERRYLELKYFPAVLDLLLEYKNCGYKVVFLTARLPRYFDVTKFWLNCLPKLKGDFQLFLVSNPKFKLKFVRWGFFKKDIIYIDDLSYNSEKGVTFFYEDCIQYIRKRKVKYIGFEDLIKLQLEINEI